MSSKIAVRDGKSDRALQIAVCATAMPAKASAALSESGLAATPAAVETRLKPWHQPLACCLQHFPRPARRRPAACRAAASRLSKCSSNALPRLPMCGSASRRHSAVSALNSHRPITPVGMPYGGVSLVVHRRCVGESKFRRPPLNPTPCESRPTDCGVFTRS